MTTYQKIRKAMLDNERRVLKLIRSYNKAGRSFGYMYPTSKATRNAADRLIAKGKIYYSPAKFSYVVRKKAIKP